MKSSLLRFFGKTDSDYDLKLINFLKDKYGGKVVLTYKGREALRLAFRACNLKGATIGICGFTCFVVYEAVIREGYKVEYLDIGKDSLNFSYETLAAAYKKNPKIKVVVIQNTLGYPCDIDPIVKFCKNNDIVLIEDLAHSIYAKYANGSEAGTIGDITMLSFSQDKVVDNVSGGAVIVRNPRLFKNLEAMSVMHAIDTRQSNKERYYPLITTLIRSMYPVGIGKILHFFAKKFNVLSNPMNYSDSDRIHTLPAGYSKEIYFQFKTLGQQMLHRRKIAEIYVELLNKKILSNKICKNTYLSANLRFPIFLSNRIGLVLYLKKNNIYVSDIWYDAPISPKKFLDKTNYTSGTCPNSEYVSERILNLPTHKNVSESDAEFISKKINEWLGKQ